MRLILFLTLFVFLLSFVEAYQLGVGPSEIEMNSGECTEIYVFSKDYVGKIEITDKWAEKRGERLEDYNQNADDFGLDVRYFDNLELNGVEKARVCISGSGRYYGLILFRAMDGNLEVGARVVFNGNRSNYLSGLIVHNLESYNSDKGLRELVMISSFMVSLASIWLLFFI